MKCRLVNENFKSNYGENLLKSRGVEDIELFLNPTENCLQSWKNLDNIKDGVNCIFALPTNANIGLIVDCDTDGFTSSTIIYKYLKRYLPECKITYYLHDGKAHGLEEHWEVIQEENYDLLIVPDAGSNDKTYAEKINCPILVIDHHLVEDSDSFAKNMIVINNQISKNYLNKDLTGAGVAYQFCRAMDYYFNLNYADDYIDLAALGIVGDMGNILSLENRYIVLKGLNNIKNFFFKSILDKQSFSTKGKVNPMTVAFYIVPLINAMIRVGSMAEKIRLFEGFIDGSKKIPSGKRGAKGALEYAAIESVRECVNARSKQNKLLEEATFSLENKVHKLGLLDNKILFVRLDEDDTFPSELNGLLAMRAAAKFKKPTIVARLNKEGYIRGSIRNVQNGPLESLKDFLQESNCFEYVQGHDNAAGCSIPNKNLEMFHTWANLELANVDFGEGTYDVNFVRAAADKDIKDLVIDLAKYEDTWGQNNNEALIYIHDLNITRDDWQVMGKNQDTLKINKFGISYMKFFAKDLIKELEQLDEIKINLVGKANLNEWMGTYTPQIFIEAYELEDNTYGF